MAYPHLATAYQSKNELIKTSMATFTVFDFHLLYLICLGEIMINGKLKINLVWLPYQI